MIKLLKVALASCVSLLAMTAAARADFIFTPLTFLLFSGPLGAIAGPGAIYAGLQVAAFAGLAAAQLAFSGGQKNDPGKIKNTFQEAETSEFNAVGRVRLGGLKAFGNTKAKIISRLIWHAKGPLIGIERWFLGGREVIIGDGGLVESPPWAKPGGSYATIQTKVGMGSETSWPELMADFPTLWTSDHRCRGILQSLVRFLVPNLNNEAGNKKFQKLYQGGAPDLEVEARVSAIYDPRKPGHGVDNPATWEWTDNGILVAAHIMRSYPDLTSADFDWAFLSAEANRADVLVATKSGTERRARCWGVWPSESRRGDTMQQVLDSIGAEIVLTDSGLIRIRLIDDAPTSEIRYPERHNVEMTWKSGPEAVERPNVCRIKYYSPERNYDMAEIDMTGIAWARVDTEIDRYGEKIYDVELPFCPSASQAQRIARRLFLMARADAGTLRTNMLGLTAWGKTYAEIEDGDAGEDMLCKIGAPRIDDPAGQVDIPYTVWPQALIDTPWNPATMEAAPPLVAPDIEYESEIATPAAPTAAVLVQYPNGSYEARAAMAAVTGASIYEAVLRIINDDEPEPLEGMTEYAAVGISETPVGGWFAFVASAPADRAEFKSRVFNSDEEGSNFSPVYALEPFAVNAAAPAAPAVAASEDGTTITVNVVSQSITAVEAVIEKSMGSPSSYTEAARVYVRPGQVSTATFTQFGAGTLWIRTHVEASGAVPGPATTITLTLT